MFLIVYFSKEILTMLDKVLDVLLFVVLVVFVSNLIMGTI
jgi:hypothetical protein